MSAVIRIGIAKGRGFLECASLLRGEKNIELPEEFLRERLTVVEDAGTQVIALRGSDLPWLLGKGHIDVAVGSSVWFAEHDGGSTMEALPLNVGCCRLSLMAHAGSAVRRICTRFPSLTRSRLRARYPEAEIITMAGSNEVSIVLGFADAIVDVVETGWTLCRFGLRELEVLEHVRHGIWVRRDDLRAGAAVSRLALETVMAGELP
ncbi:MAG TPA: ATP phosphoribosyltransferase [Thermoanaerobaculia bacterium]